MKTFYESEIKSDTYCDSAALFTRRRITLSCIGQNLTVLNLLNIAVVIVGALCFLPQIIGYEFVLSTYPDSLASLSGPLFNYSLVASIAATTPLLLENVMNFATKLYFNPHGQWSENEISYFKFPTAILVLIIVTDLLLLNYIIPNQLYDFLPGLISCRDVLFTWSFLVNLHKLGGSIWTLPKVSFIIFCSGSLNLIYTWVAMSETAAVSSDLLNLQYALTSSIILALLIFAVMWFYHIYKMNHEILDLRANLINIQTSVFVVFICMYIIADFAPGLAASTESPEWYGYGESNLTMLTYMMTGCVICVNIITTSISKIGSLEVSKVLYYCQNILLCCLFDYVYVYVS